MHVEITLGFEQSSVAIAESSGSFGICLEVQNANFDLGAFDVALPPFQLTTEGSATLNSKIINLVITIIIHDSVYYRLNVFRQRCKKLTSRLVKISSIYKF